MDDDGNGSARNGADRWSGDEHRFSRNYELEGGVPVYCVPAIGGGGRLTVEEVLARASGEAAQDLREMHEMLFSGVRTIEERAIAVMAIPEADRNSMDCAAIDAVFSSKIVLADTAMASLIRDNEFPPSAKTELLGYARAVTAMLIKLNDVAISVKQAKDVSSATAAGQMVSDAGATWRYMPPRSAELSNSNATQRLYQIASKRALKLQYARYKDCFMRRIVTSDGFITNAWEKACTFLEFVQDMTKDPDGEILHLATSALNTMDNVAELLKKMREALIPWLKPDRHVFAFRNGCYMAKQESFVLFSREAVPTMPDGSLCPIACKYHDVEVDPRWMTGDPMEIPTPLMDFIMDTQQLSPDVKRVYFSMLGRALYDLGEMDNWQVFLFVKGAAETGKSTLLKFMGSVYNTEDVGILSNNVESTFGASMISDKFVVIGDDLGENFALDQQLFQNMCSGNDVSLPQKNKRALVLKWNTQLLMAGNVIMDYRDNFGSFSRRLLIIHYSKPVMHVDPTIPDRLRQEIGAAIIKCNRCYRNMVRRLNWLLNLPEHRVTFWDAIPECFRIEKANVMQCSNSIMSFLHSGALVFGSSLYMPKAMFLEQLQTHCAQINMPKARFQPTLYEGPFASMQLSISQGKQKRAYPRNSANERVDMWVLGCDLATSEVTSKAFENIAAAAAAAAANQAAGEGDDARAIPGEKRPAPDPPAVILHQNRRPRLQ